MLAASQPRSAPVGRKLPKNYRITEEAVAMLDQLARLHGVSHTAVIEQAIREKHRRERKLLGPENPGQNRPISG